MWEYKTLNINTYYGSDMDSVLNRLGADDWELVKVIRENTEDATFIFKRANREWLEAQAREQRMQLALYDKGMLA